MLLGRSYGPSGDAPRTRWLIRFDDCELARNGRDAASLSSQPRPMNGIFVAITVMN